MFKQQKREVRLQAKEEEMMIRRQTRKTTDHPDLSLGPSVIANSSFSESAAQLGGGSKKRKQSWDEPLFHTCSIELQLNSPLPLDWEQCLDLQSGRMYYLNRKTLKRIENGAEEQKLDLELNISTLPVSSERMRSCHVDSNDYVDSSDSNDMVAVACLKCHLLVMLCKTSPSCPNCKFLHPLPASQPAPQIPKPFETLNLLN